LDSGKSVRRAHQKKTEENSRAGTTRPTPKIKPLNIKELQKPEPIQAKTVL
jgi:hypothetical protein